MGIEIERKFLVQSPAWQDALKAGPSQELAQGYLPLADGQLGELRVRVEYDQGIPRAAWLTIKGEGTLSRQETEVALDPDAAVQMLEVAGPNVIEKIRHRVDIGQGLVAEVDVYSGKLAGLVVAEVELPSEDTALPSLGWLGQEVTEDKAYKNKSLALKGAPGIEPRRGPKPR